MCINFSCNKLPHIKIFGLDLTNKSKRVRSVLTSKPSSDIFEKSLFSPDFAIINKPIETMYEYQLLLNKLKNSMTNNEMQYAYFTEMNDSFYNFVDKELEGLLPYCGVDDSSKLINMYLSGRLTEKEYKDHFYAMPKDISTLPDVVRVLQYSLGQLDIKYGKYSGIVYRQGYMDENPSQYLSTTSDSKIVSKFKNPTGKFQPNRNYSVIKVKNGHKIYEFQQRAGELGRLYAQKEREIVLPFDNKYKKLDHNELTQELYDAKVQLASSFFIGKEGLYALEESNGSDYTVDDLLNMIDVYLQI